MQITQKRYARQKIQNNVFHNLLITDPAFQFLVKDAPDIIEEIKASPIFAVGYVNRPSQQ